MFFIDGVSMSLHYGFIISLIYFFFHELENFFSEHFVWTLNSIPAASQVVDLEDSSEDVDDDGMADDTNNFDWHV